MPTTPDLARYEKFGWDYPSVNPLTEAEVRWHVGWAKRTGSPVLGLACGTGRLLCRLAEAGFEAVGVDLADRMLAIARQNRASLPPDAQARLHLVRTDMANFDLGRSFNLIFIADNSFRELPSRKALLACLRCIWRHLTQTGKLLITERRFDAGLYPGGERSFGWSEPIRNPDSGLLVTGSGSTPRVR